MKPKLVKFKCPACGKETGEIPISMGDKVIKCNLCGKFMKFRWRTMKVEKIHEPARENSSGSILY